MKKERTAHLSEVQSSPYDSGAPGLILKRDYRNVRLVLFLLCEDYLTGYKCIEGVVLAHSHIGSRIVHGASLAYDDVACLYDLTTELLHSQSFAMRFTTVLRT